MRGKLRDKRADVRRDRLRRDRDLMLERRRTPKRENRAVAILYRQYEDDEMLDGEELEKKK